MSIQDRIKILIRKAAHANTPTEEARTCALIACKLIIKHELLFNEEDESEKEWIRSEKEDTSVPFPDDYIPDFSKVPSVEIETFKLILSTGIGMCPKCKSSYNKGEPVAKGLKNKNSTIVHYKCRRYFIGE